MVYLTVMIVGAAPLYCKRCNGTVQFFQCLQVLNAENIVRIIEQE